MHYLTDTNLKWQLIADKDSKLKQLSDLSDKIVAMTRFSGTDLLTDMALVPCSYASIFLYGRGR